MNDWIGLGFILLVILGVLLGLSRLGKPSKQMSEEEFERRVREGPGVMSAGVMGLQKILDPGAEKAVAVQQDLKAGHYKDEEKQGEGDESGRKNG